MPSAPTAGAYAVVPARNLIINIGFDHEATHTVRPSPHEVDVPTHQLTFPLTHPAEVRAGADFELALYRHCFPLMPRLVTTLPRGARVKTQIRGTLEEILVGPAHENDGRLNLFGALRTSMATCGYQSVKEFQKAEVMIAPALQTEGKSLQRSQGVGMGH